MPKGTEGRLTSSLIFNGGCHNWNSLCQQMYRAVLALETEPLATPGGTLQMPGTSAAAAAGDALPHSRWSSTAEGYLEGPSDSVPSPMGDS